MKISCVRRALMFFGLLVLLAGCASNGTTYFDQVMDFGAVHKVAVLPFENLTPDKQAADRVRDVFMGKLLETEAVYVIPPGEVARGVSRAGVKTASAPSAEEVVKLGTVIGVDAVITGVLKEYGEVRSGNASGNIISLSVQMLETQTGKVVWVGSTTEGGISTWDRMFGSGGEPMNDVTEKAVTDLISKLLG
jgi:hypothetical protein